MNNPQAIVASEIMVQPVVCTTPSTPLADFEQELLAKHVSGMPVVDHGELVGFISKTDLTRLSAVQASVQGYIDQQLSDFASSDKADSDSQPIRLLNELTVRDAMRGRVVTCSPTTSILELAEKMLDYQVHRVVVVDGQDVVGMVSALDFAKLLVLQNRG